MVPARARSSSAVRTTPAATRSCGSGPVAVASSTASAASAATSTRSTRAGWASGHHGPFGPKIFMPNGPDCVRPGSAFSGDQRLKQDVGVLALYLAEPPLVAEQREQGAVVAAGQHLRSALPGQDPGALGVGAPGQRVVQVVQVRAGAELVLEPVQHHVVLQRADRGQYRSLVAAQVGGQHLDDALGVELLDPAPELLLLARFLP